MINNIRKTGATLNPRDSRDISIHRVMNPSAIKRPSAYKVDLSKLPTYNQLSLGTCTAQAETGAVEYNEVKDTGSYKNLSTRYTYVLEKSKVVNPTDDGTNPRAVAMNIVNGGIATNNSVPSDNTLSFAEYMKVDVSKYTEEAFLSKQRGVAFVPSTYEDIANTIFTHGIITFTVPFVGNWNPTTGEITNGFGTPNGYHRMRFYGYDDATQTLYYINSWGEWGELVQGLDGKHGCGRFKWADIQVYDVQAYTDIPTKILEEVRAVGQNLEYVWNADLTLGARSQDVLMLQRALYTQGFFYKENIGDLLPTGYFGDITKQSLIRWQLVNKLPAYGYFGKISRTLMNNKYQKKNSTLTP